MEKLCYTELEGGKEIKKLHPKVFFGLGTFGKEYEIQLKEDASPHALYASRNIPIALRTKVKEELNRIEQLGVIRKILDPTDWCAGMVVVPKKSGAIHIVANFPERKPGLITPTGTPTNECN